MINGILYLCLILIALAGFCLYTKPGTEATLEIINSYTDYKIKYQTFSGTLGTSLEFKDFQLESEDYTLDAQEIRLNWDWMNWHGGMLHINYLKAENANLFIKRSEDTHTLPSTFKETLQTIRTPKDLENLIKKQLRLPIGVSKISIKNSHIRDQSGDHAIEVLKLNNLQTHSHFMDSFIYKGSFGSIEAILSNGFKISWSLTILSNWQIPSLTHDDFKTEGCLSFNPASISKHNNLLQVKISAANLTLDEHNFENLEVNIQGTLQSHLLKIVGNYTHHFDLEILGTSINSKWVGSINHLILNDPKYKPFHDVKGKIEIDHDTQLKIAVNLKSSQQTAASQLYVDTKPPFALKGFIQAHVNELKSIEGFFPIPEQATGSAECKINISGSVVNPVWDGSATLKKMDFATPQYGSTGILDSVTFTKFKNKPNISIKGTGYINNSIFSIDGSVFFKNFNPELIVNIEGENLIVSQTPEFYISASPKLRFTLLDDIPSLSGTIFIPKAKIAPTNTNKTSLSPDIVIVNSQSTQTQDLDSSLHPLDTDITIILGSDVTFKGEELLSSFGGQLRLVQKPYKVPRLHGTLNLINGSYRFQGKTFLLTRGKLIYSGNTFNNPLMDIEAKQKILPFSTAKATNKSLPTELGVKLTGQFSNPKISFFSVPMLSEADIISYLILGRPQSEAAQAQDVILLQALSQLSTIFGHKGDLSLSLAEKLHLDYISIGKNHNGSHSSLENVVLTLGKQISNRLYLNYSLGLYGSSNNIALQYKLNKNISIEAQTGTSSSSADLIFSLDS